jgi:hypothetical protein
MLKQVQHDVRRILLDPKNKHNLHRHLEFISGSNGLEGGVWR